MNWTVKKVLFSVFKEDINSLRKTLELPPQVKKMKLIKKKYKNNK